MLAVSNAKSSRAGRPLLPLALLAALGGCSFVGDATEDTASIGAGAVVGGITGNPFIGIAVGIAARWAAAATVDAAERAIHEQVQDRIATVAGAAEPEVAMPWAIEQRLPHGSGAGTVIVVREFGAPAIPCREIVYSAFRDDDTDFYVGTICRAPSGTWKWAVSEPAVSRWGSLQ